MVIKYRQTDSDDELSLSINGLHCQCHTRRLICAAAAAVVAAAGLC